MNQENNQRIALVDEEDNVTGYAEKLDVHLKGLLHRAFSVFLFNDKNQMLLQQRAHSKYHSPGLWTNTCCSHLLENSTMEECVNERLLFEMGIKAECTEKFVFQYRAPFDNGLTENEIDHVYIGRWDGIPDYNPDEVSSVKWISIESLKSEIEANPEKYTYWFRHILAYYSDKLIEALEF